ncbi:MAG: demethoxyubiquinone hydroxylase family protein [Alphaproteobacteria bacterium]|nr:demethoxyubiquinone hydroxylase family protein [Alphaproteobacteria bacterium]
MTSDQSRPEPAERPDPRNTAEPSPEVHRQAQQQAQRPPRAVPRGHRELPGDLTKAQLIDRIIRVDHAGEFGAQRIYAGQLSVLRNPRARAEVIRMAEQEKAHYREFERLVSRRRARPTLLHPVWSMAGWLLGAGTAMLGSRGAMACTVAVEAAIVEHYQRQIDALEAYPEEQELRDTLAEFRDAEQDHHDTGLAHEAEKAPFYELLTGLIQRSSRVAIWLSERI